MNTVRAASCHQFCWSIDLSEAIVHGTGRASRVAAIAWLHSEGLKISPNQAHDAAMLDHHAFGHSRRARRVDQVGEAVRGEPGRIRRRCPIPAPLRGPLDDIHDGMTRRQVAEAHKAGFVGQDHGRPRILQNGAHLCIRKERIDAREGPARFQNRQLVPWLVLCSLAYGIAAVEYY